MKFMLSNVIKQFDHTTLKIKTLNVEIKIDYFKKNLFI